MLKLWMLCNQAEVECWLVWFLICACQQNWNTLKRIPYFFLCVCWCCLKFDTHTCSSFSLPPLFASTLLIRKSKSLHQNQLARKEKKNSKATQEILLQHFRHCNLTTVTLRYFQFWSFKLCSFCSSRCTYTHTQIHTVFTALKALRLCW